MMPTDIPTIGPSVEWGSAAPTGSKPDEDIALLFYALLDGEDLQEVFGEFLVPSRPGKIDASR
jgi:hypothetical protein